MMTNHLVEASPRQSRPISSLIAGLSFCLLAACGQAGSDTPTPSGQSSADTISSLHQRLLVLDTHLDTPARFHTADYVFSERGNWATDGTHVDLPRMNEGGLDGGFWVIYLPQGQLSKDSYAAALTVAILRQMAIREFAAKYSDDVALAFSADDAEQIAQSGRKVVFQSMENAYPLGEDLSLLSTFYTGGLRMVAPVHYLNNQFADSATDISPLYGGLSPLGEDLVREANRLGMLIDGSHASDDAIRDMMQVSSTPIILSHSSLSDIHDHPRNVPDDLLLELAADGGVIQVTVFGSYLEALVPSPERQAAIDALETEYGASLGPSFYKLSQDDQQAFRAALKDINERYPPPRSSFDKFMEHLLHALELVGPDHVGIGADWDGGGGVDGLEDVSQLPRITQALMEAGYSEQDLEKIWGGNVLRLLREAEMARSVEISSPTVLN